MKKFLFFIAMCLCAIGVKAADTYTVNETSGSTVTVDGTTATFSKLAAGDISSWGLGWNGTPSINTFNSVTTLVFTDGSTLSTEDVTTMFNSYYWTTKAYNLYSATVSDDVVTAIASNAGEWSGPSLVLPLNSTITDEQLEAEPFTKCTYVVRFTDNGQTLYCAWGSSDAVTSAMTVIAQYMTNVTKMTTNGLYKLSLAGSDFEKYSNGTVKDYTTKNATVSSDVSFSSKAVEKFTMSSCNIQGTFTLDDCEGLTEVNIIDNSVMKALKIVNCDEIDHIDLKNSIIAQNFGWSNGTVTLYNGVNGTLTIQGNTKLRYIIMPHNFCGTTDVEDGNDALLSIIATRHTGTTTDADGNTVPVILANYTMYGNGICDEANADMKAIAQSQHYGHCTIVCMNKAATPNKAMLADESNFYTTNETISTGFSDGTTSTTEHSYVALKPGDVEVINGFNADTLDLARSFYQEPTQTVWKNPYAKYLILPDNMDYFLMTEYNAEHPTMNSRLTGCDNLLGAVSYMGDVDQGNGNSALGKEQSSNYGNIKGFMTYSTKEGVVNRLLAIPYYHNLKVYADSVSGARPFMTPSNIENIVCIGKLNAEDFCASEWTRKRINSEGHYVNAIVSDNPSATNNTSNLGNCKRLDLTRAVFPTQNDMMIGNGNFGSLQEIYLPIDASMTMIPDSCLYDGEKGTFSTICIPGNYKTIGEFAFAAGSTKLMRVYTTAVKSDGGGYPARTNDWEYDESKLIDMFDETEHSETLDSDGEKGGCYTFSATLESIGTQAFGIHTSEYVKDVYCMGTVAPKCAFNAFTGTSYMNNNGYNSTAAAESVTREVYGGGGKWMAYLHFPENCSDAEKAHYTDVTRKYSIPDQDGRTDGNGNIVMWPTQSEWNRSEAQAVAGVTWEFWKDGDDGDINGWGAHKYIGDWRCTASDATGFLGGTSQVSDVWLPGSNNDYISWNGDELLQKYYGYSLLSSGAKALGSANETGANSIGSASETNSEAPCNEWVDTDNLDAVYDTDYMGWHQFVLAYTSMSVEKQYDAYVKDDWYTICVPTDLTKAEVLKYFGVPAEYNATIDGKSDNAGTDVYPEIRTLYGVDRNMKTQMITFQFTDDLTQGKTWKFDEGSYYLNQEAEHYEEATGNDDVIMYAGCPYIIKPYVPVAVDTMSNYTYKPGTWVLSQKTGVKVDVIGDGKYIKCPRLDYKVHAIRTLEDGSTTQTELEEGSTDESKVYYYHFVGTYEKTAMPQYCFFLSNSKKKPAKKWYKNSKTTRNWNPTIAIMGALGEVNDSTASVSLQGTQGATDVTTVHYITYEDVVEDNLFSLTSGAKVAPSYAMAFGHTDQEETVTGIVEVTTLNEEEDTATGTVYGINGQKVGNSLEGLSKGVYILNGKKYVVK